VIAAEKRAEGIVVIVVGVGLDKRYEVMKNIPFLFQFDGDNGQWSVGIMDHRMQPSLEGQEGQFSSKVAVFSQERKSPPQGRSLQSRVSDRNAPAYRWSLGGEASVLLRDW